MRQLTSLVTQFLALESRRHSGSPSLKLTSACGWRSRKMP